MEALKRYPNVKESTMRTWIKKGGMVQKIGRPLLLPEEWELTVVSWITQCSDWGWLPRGPDIKSFVSQSVSAWYS